MKKSIALVTGAAQGIGLACAEALLEQGHFVILSDINADLVKAASQKLGKQTDFVGCDMSDPKAINSMFDEIETKHGGISVLVNNAGIAMPKPFFETSVEDFRKVIDINLVGVFLAIQRAAKSMIANKIEGAIVNMSSINAVVAIPTIASYCASKGGVMQLTKATSLALAPHGIRVNAVGPGSIDTEMMAGVNANPEAMKMVMSRTPLQRIGLPREIGDVVAFLASPKASYITGETIYVDGGRLGMNYTC
ncbi:dehydrogenase [Afipia sp. Root123D2]|uniref:SDR family NAD(P)-dependent oxidoreductase n=1 Tax=Afipia sp. Root123D2 TaxID=1736436 RepID=UPI0006F47225|nr:SDR family oxidoreductase [Afipia sp. Root123D2]KQW20893.1 dehydrogenase [Afipia sp. Root123D2]